MLEPQSTALFILLLALFGALMWWMLATRRVTLRVFAACLAFIPAMVFGVLAVNKYYGYYQTWGAMVADFTQQDSSAASGPPDIKVTTNSQSGTLDGSRESFRLAQRQGYLVRQTVTGHRSGITRKVYAYLPPQYFQPAYRAYRFPVIELIHGQPGTPQDWISAVGVTQAFDQLLAAKQAQPAVLLMPDANGGRQISLQCLNQAGGPQDLTYLAVDLPAQISRTFRVAQPGGAWGVAGYSEGGFCAANMALRYPRHYGFAGVLSGYFEPMNNKPDRSGRLVSPFGGNSQLRAENTPLVELTRLPPGAVIPRFWLAAGTADRQDVANAERFWRALPPRLRDVRPTLTPGTGHTMTTWRAEIPSMLTWMTHGMTRAAHQHPAVPPRRTAVLAETGRKR